MHFVCLTSTAVKEQSPPCSEYLFLSKVVTCSAPIMLHWAAHFSLVHCHRPAPHTLEGLRVKKRREGWRVQKKRMVMSERLRKHTVSLTRCCISAGSCPLTGRCVCGGNTDSRLFLDRVPGEGRGPADTHSPQHTPPCTGSRLQQARGAGETHSWGDRRTHSPKTPGLWDRHDLERQRKRVGAEYNISLTCFSIMCTIQSC